ncbi:M15 family metallopeptidase [Turicibacter sanguinis]|uniref:M15 family metallopeptidase n=1 Tax=Turicibacter sanguinis TaxID=154288 RepID=UPI001E556B4B|nr:M15 family metallopeptidase [Turicibacter sanguinis]
MAKKNVVIKRKKKKLILIRLSIISLILLTSIIYVATILNKPHFTTQAQTIEYLNDSLIVSNLETRSIPNRFSTEQREYLASFNLPDETLEQLTSSPKFNIDSMQTYANILKSNRNYSVQYALNYVLYPNVKTNFYKDTVEVAHPDNLLVLVNKNYRLPSDYIPSDLVYLNVPLYRPDTNNEANYLRKVAADALSSLFSAANQEKGYALIARSGYRSYKTQVNLYNNYVSTNGQQYADSYSARAGHSEHQTGLTIDITAKSVNEGLSQTFGQSKEGAWVAENAHKFGFIIRYPQGRTAETGYEYEPWHLRYVGVDAATYIYENNLILEDYLLEKGDIGSL